MIDIMAVQLNLSKFHADGFKFLADDNPDERIYNPALGFDPFLDHCNRQLEDVFNKKFKRNEMFREMLMDICKAEAQIRLMRQLKLIPNQKQKGGETPDDAAAVNMQNNIESNTASHGLLKIE